MPPSKSTRDHPDAYARRDAADRPTPCPATTRRERIARDVAECRLDIESPEPPTNLEGE